MNRKYRKTVIAGNWKMNKTPTETKAFMTEFKAIMPKGRWCDVALCVPAVCIPAAVRAMRETRVGIGAENRNANASGAYTGEIAANMLLDAGCKYVILGHSERRAMGETNADVNAKVLAALDNGLIPIMCVGESLEQREAGITEEWVRSDQDRPCLHQQLRIWDSGSTAGMCLRCDKCHHPGSGKWIWDRHSSGLGGLWKAGYDLLDGQQCAWCCGYNFRWSELRSR